MAVEINAPVHNARIIPFRRPNWNPNHPALQPPLPVNLELTEPVLAPKGTWLDRDAAAAIRLVLEHAREFIPEPKMIDSALELLALGSPEVRS